MSTTRFAIVALAVVSILAVAPAPPSPAYAASKSCKVSLTVGLNNTVPNDVKTKYTFGIGANSAEACADVVYGLLVTEQLPDGSRKSTEVPGDMRVRGQTRIEVITWETDSKNTLKGFEAKMHSCQICDAP